MWNNTGTLKQCLEGRSPLAGGSRGIGFSVDLTVYFDVIEDMVMQLQIETRNVDLTPAWKADIENRMSKLHTGHDSLIHGRVTLTKNLHHHKTHDGAEALIVVSISGRHTITARKAEQTFEEAIRAAFAAIQVELRKYRDKRASTTVRSTSPPLRGMMDQRPDDHVDKDTHSQDDDHDSNSI